MEDALRMVEDGACSVWPLPADPTCAGIARRIFRGAADEFALDPMLVDDGVTMVSELAANTLHAHRAAPEAGPELWLYPRGAGPRRELVCKVFDSYPGWLRAPGPGGACRVPLESVSGRGLAVVHEMSAGRWGYHLTRSRLGHRPVRGKAVWFAVPAAASAASAVPPSVLPGNTGLIGNTGLPGNAGEAMRELEAALTARGFEEGLVRADDPAADMAVLSVASGITAWCRAGAAWLRSPAGTGQRWGYADLIEVAEQTVEAYETLMEDTRAAAAAADDATTRTGALMSIRPTGNM
ncbi:MAG: ATP-binding protein [Trebonia sp.]